MSKPKTVEEALKSRDQAYWERNQLVAALSKIFPAHLELHPESDTEWDDDWRTIVVMYLPAGVSTDFIDSRGPVKDYQLTWHIHDFDVAMFDHLKLLSDDLAHGWDRHTTPEKYKRLRTLVPGLIWSAIPLEVESEAEPAQAGSLSINGGEPDGGN